MSCYCIKYESHHVTTNKVPTKIPMDSEIFVSINKNVLFHEEKRAKLLYFFFYQLYIDTKALTFEQKNYKI